MLPDFQELVSAVRRFSWENELTFYLKCLLIITIKRNNKIKRNDYESKHIEKKLRCLLRYQ